MTTKKQVVLSDAEIAELEAHKQRCLIRNAAADAAKAKRESEHKKAAAERAERAQMSARKMSARKIRATPERTAQIRQLDLDDTLLRQRLETAAQAFLAQHCELDTTVHVPCSDLIQKWEAFWVARHPATPAPVKLFTRWLTRAGFGSAQHRSGVFRIRKGLRLIDRAPAQGGCP